MTFWSLTQLQSGRATGIVTSISHLRVVYSAWLIVLLQGGVLLTALQYARKRGVLMKKSHKDRDRKLLPLHCICGRYLCDAPTGVFVTCPDCHEMVTHTNHAKQTKQTKQAKQAKQAKGGDQA